MQHRTFYKDDIPLSVRNIVIAVCQDYRRRKRNTDRSKEELPAQMRMNAAVEGALEPIEKVLRPIILSDIENYIGFYASEARHMMAKGTYYQRKRQFMRGVAERLGVL